MFLISSSHPSICGGHFSSEIGLILSHQSATRLVLVTTISYAFSLDKYSNSLSISSVVLKYNGACISASSYPCPACIILLYISSSGFIKCTSHVPTTGLFNLSAIFTISTFISIKS